MLTVSSGLSGITYPYQPLLKPEESMSIQHAIGGDIMMQLDDVVSSLTTGPRVGEAMQRSVRWLDRCIEFHQKSGRDKFQNLFAIVQGGLDPEMRKKCLEQMVLRKDKVAGFAIGGLSGGEAKGGMLGTHINVSSHVGLTDPKKPSGKCKLDCRTT